MVGGSGVNCQLQAIGPKLIFPQLIWVEVVVPKEQGPQLKTTQKSAMGAAEVQSLSQEKLKVGCWWFGGSEVNYQLQAIGPKLIFPQLIWVVGVVPKEQGPRLKITQKSGVGPTFALSLFQESGKGSWVVRW